MPARALTDPEVRAVKAEPGRRVILYDAKARGLCLRVTPGTKSWSFVYRPKGSARQRRYTIGDYPAWSLSAAREKALGLRRMVQDGGDPVAEAKTRREALTVSGMVERFIVRHAKVKLRSWATYEALLKRDVIPVFGERRADEVTRAEIANLLDSIADRAPVVSNRVLNTLSSVFSWAVSEGLVPSNPVRGLRKRSPEVAKSRTLSDEEIRVFWAASESAGPGYRDLFRLILLTGQRPGECAGITAQELDLGKALWTIPGARTKNKLAHTVPLVGKAFSIVARLRDSETGPLIRTSRGRCPTAQDSAKAFERLRKSGLFETTATPHDLRRTAATVMARLEIDRLTIAHVLNHASTTKATVTGSVYDKHDPIPQKRRALEALDAEIERILSNAEPALNVVKLARSRP